jgi:HK97 gp10 family phage protein
VAEIDIEIQGLKETQAEMERVVSELQGAPFLAGMRKATLIVQRDAKIKAPVDTGRLRASITPEVTRGWGGTRGIVGSNVRYAPFVELGTRGPRFVPRQYIGRWAKRHGMGDRGIIVSGNPKPFLQPAFDENKERIVEILGDTVKGIVK